MKTYITIAIFASMTFLGVNNVEAQNHQRGYMGFSTFDTNEDNIITEKEFNTVKDEMVKNSKGQGQGKNKGQVKGMNVSFSDIDKDGDGDGKVTIKEYDAFHAEMMKKHQAYRKGYNNGYRHGKGHRNMMNAKEIFAKMDTNSDKFINEDEMIVFRQKRMKEQSDKGGQLKNVGNAPSFESLDLNNDGKVSEEEFMTAHKKMMKKHKSNGNRHGHGNMMPPMPEFSDMDKNGNGTVTEEEFIEFRQERVKKQVDKGGQMRGLAESPTFDSIDKNKDGKIDKSEFDLLIENDCRRSK